MAGIKLKDYATASPKIDWEQAMRLRGNVVYRLFYDLMISEGIPTFEKKGDGTKLNLINWHLGLKSSGIGSGDFRFRFLCKP